MTRYFKFIAIYVVLWIPYMLLGILDVIIGFDKVSLSLMFVAQSFMILTGTANGIMWFINERKHQTSIQLIHTNKDTKSQHILNKNQRRIGINSSKMITFTDPNQEAETSTKPLDYDPVSKIGPRSMYNGDDDTPTMMLIDNTVNEYKYELTSTTVTQDGYKQETRLF